MPTGSIRLASHAPIPALPGYDEGAWWVQDAAAALPARILAVKPGQRVLDLCAAPGGKTAQLAAAGARVIALDRSAERLKTLSANLARLQLEAAISVGDAAAYKAEPFDAILLDAPCSATGTARRSPDVLWTKKPGDLAALAAIQAKILDHAVTFAQAGRGAGLLRLFAGARGRRGADRAPCSGAIPTSRAIRSIPRPLVFRLRPPRGKANCGSSLIFSHMTTRVSGASTVSSSRV